MSDDTGDTDDGGSEEHGELERWEGMKDSDAEIGSVGGDSGYGPTDDDGESATHDRDQ